VHEDCGAGARRRRALGGLIALALAVAGPAVAAQVAAPAPPAPVQAVGGGAPRLVVAPAALDLGTVWWGDTARGSLQLRNAGDRPLHVLGIRSTCGCTAATVPDDGRVLPPGATVEVPVFVTPRDGTTPLERHLDLETDDPAAPLVRVAVRCDVVVGVALSPSHVLFEDLELGETRSMEVTVESHDGEAFALEAVEFGSPLYRAEFAPGVRATAHHVRVTTGPVAQRRNPSSWMQVRTTHGRTPVLRVNANSMVAPVVSTSARALACGPPDAAGVAVGTMELWERATGLPLTAVTARTPKLDGLRIDAVRDESSPRRWRFTVHVAEELRGRPLGTPVILETSADRSEPLVMMLGIASGVPESGGGH
jgi:hypothetical protein